MYVNTLTVCDILIVVPVQQLFSQLFFNGQAVVEACSYYAALTSLLAVIRSRCRGCPAAVFHSYPGTERYSCMYVCMLESIIILF
jgi:hypothetical protein